MRIVHVSYASIKDYTDPQAWLTRINFFVALVEEMAKQSEVFSLHCINYEGVMHRNGVQYRFLGCNAWRLVQSSKMQTCVREIVPDVIVVHGFHFPWQVLSLRRAIGKNTPIFIQHHAETPLKNYKGILQPVIDRFVSAYFFTARDQAKPWVAKGQIATIDKVHEVMEVPSVFRAVDKLVARQHLGIERDRQLYLWVGRLDKNKDPGTLIRGFVRFALERPDVTLYIIYRGDELIGEAMDLLNACDPQIRKQIVLLGTVQHADMQYWFSSSDFIISTSHYEGSGVAVCEGMSCGCIPIVTNIPSFRMMTQNASVGFLFETGSMHSFHEQLLASTKLEIPTTRARVLDHYTSHLSANAISTKMIAVFKKVLKIS